MGVVPRQVGLLASVLRRMPAGLDPVTSHQDSKVVVHVQRVHRRSSAYCTPDDFCTILTPPDWCLAHGAHDVQLQPSPQTSEAGHYRSAVASVPRAWPATGRCNPRTLPRSGPRGWPTPGHISLVGPLLATLVRNGARSIFSSLRSFRFRPKLVVALSVIRSGTASVWAW